MRSDIDRLIETYATRVTLRKRRQRGADGSHTYRTKFECEQGHAHQDMVSACLCTEHADHPCPTCGAGMSLSPAASYWLCRTHGPMAVTTEEERR